MRSLLPAKKMRKNLHCAENCLTSINKLDQVSSHFQFSSKCPFSSIFCFLRCVSSSSSVVRPHQSIIFRHQAVVPHIQWGTQWRHCLHVPSTKLLEWEDIWILTDHDERQENHRLWIRYILLNGLISWVFLQNFDSMNLVEYIMIMKYMAQLYAQSYRQARAGTLLREEDRNWSHLELV